MTSQHFRATICSAASTVALVLACQGAPSTSESASSDETSSSQDASTLGSASQSESTSSATGDESPPPDLPGCIVSELHLNSPDDFEAAQGVCEVTSLLLISGDSLSGTLPPLPNLTRAGTVGIENTLLTDLDGLFALERTEDFLLIQNNPELHDISGLDALERVGGLYILDTPGYLLGDEPLEVGLPGLATSTVRFEMVDDLTSISAHRPLVYEDGVPNPLVNLRLPSLLDKEGTERFLTGSTMLRLSMWPFEDLTDVAFAEGTRIIYLEDSETLSSLEGLPDLPLERFVVSRNAQLADLSALPTGALEDLRIGDCGVPDFDESRDTDNPALTSLDSLPALPVLEALYVAGQSGLTSLDPSITTATQTVWVADNPQLDPMDADTFAQAVAGPEAELIVCGNGPDGELCNGGCDWMWWEIAE